MDRLTEEEHLDELGLAESEYQSWKLREAWLDLVFVFVRSLGIIWIVKHVRFLQLKPWAQDREDGLIPLPGDRYDQAH